MRLALQLTKTWVDKLLEQQLQARALPSSPNLALDPKAVLLIYTGGGKNGGRSTCPVTAFNAHRHTFIRWSELLHCPQKGTSTQTSSLGVLVFTRRKTLNTLDSPAVVEEFSC